MKRCNDAIAVLVVKKNLPFDRCFKCSGVVAIKDDRAALHPAQPFTPRLSCLNCVPWRRLNVQYFMLSLETQTCARSWTRFSVIQYRLKGRGGFTAGGAFYTVYLLRVCVGGWGETDNRNRRNSLILMSRSSAKIHRQLR